MQPIYCIVLTNCLRLDAQEQALEGKEAEQGWE